MNKKPGFEIKAPKNKCEDPKCPCHGSLKLRGRMFTGTVVSDKLKKNAIVTWGRLQKIKKFERYEKKYSKVHAYNPECINAKTGDKVKIVECRPLSKTKNFVVVEIVEGKEKQSKEKKE